MDNNRLKHLYLTGVRPNEVKIGVGAYGRVFEVEFCGDLYAAKEIHPALIEGVEQAGFERMKRMNAIKVVRLAIIMWFVF